jgi:hypothetical protein
LFTIKIYFQSFSKSTNHEITTHSLFFPKIFNFLFKNLFKHPLYLKHSYLSKNIHTHHYNNVPYSDFEFKKFHEIQDISHQISKHKISKTNFLYNSHNNVLKTKTHTHIMGPKTHSLRSALTCLFCILMGILQK